MNAGEFMWKGFVSGWKSRVVFIIKLHELRLQKRVFNPLIHENQLLASNARRITWIFIYFPYSKFCEPKLFNNFGFPLDERDWLRIRFMKSSMKRKMFANENLFHSSSTQQNILQKMLKAKFDSMQYHKIFISPHKST